jgi:glycosyltransferase involved in cell wall biosynthesis
VELPLKVLIVVESHSTRAGGGSTYWAQLSEWLIRRGHDVRILTGIEPGAAFASENTVGLFPVRSDLRSRSLPTLISRFSFAVRLLPAVRAYARHWRPDIIHTVPPVASEAALRAGRAVGVPVVASILSHVEAQWSALERPRVRAALFRRLERGAIRRPFSRIICLTHHSRDVLLAEGMPSDQLVYVPPAIDTRKFGPRALPTVRAQLQLGRDVFIVGYAGALAPDKGVDQLIRAFARLQHRSHLRLLIAGDGAGRHALEELVTTLKLNNVTFLGALSYQDMPGFMASLDLYVLPSLTENMPASLLEALGTETPVMSTAVGGVTEFLREGRGILLQDPRAATIAAALDQWVDRRDELRQMGRNGQRYVLLHHSWDTTGPRTEEVYEQCLRLPR